MKLLFKTTNKEYSIFDALKLSKDEIIAELVANGATFETALSKQELVEKLFNDYAKKDPKTEDKLDSLSEKELELKSKRILEKATEINTLLSNAKTQEEREAILKGIDAELPIMQDLLTAFPNILNPASPIETASDLPASKIITSLPVRVVEQMVNSILTDEYELMKYVSQEEVRNGILQIFYGDFRDADEVSGFANVSIDDYNQGHEPIFSETYQVDVEIHKGMDILSSMLNDTAITIGTYVALVQDVVRGIARPFAKRIYQEVINFLDSDASATGNYDEVVEFTGADTKAKAKEFHKFLISKNTTSRTNLTKKPSGSTKALEHKVKATNLAIIINADFATDYKYDLTANTFQLGEIKLPVKSIEVLDFAKLAEYAKTPATSKLKDMEIIGIEDGVIKLFKHYSGTKIVDTPKLKSVIHRYDRFGLCRLKNKILFAFKKKSA